MGQCSSHEQMQMIEPMDYQSLDYNRYSTYQKLETIANGITQNQQINQTYSALIQRIIAGRQDHILKLLQVMNHEEKNYLIQKIENLDFETVDSLFYHCYKQSQMDIFKAKLINNIQLKGTQNLELIKNRKVGIVFLCGGNSSRLPNKILKHIGLPSRKCILQIMMERLKKIIYMSQEDMDNVTSLEDFPIAFLVSDTNCYTIKQYLKSKKDFGFPYIHILQQRSLPVINQHGQILFEKNEPILAPDGTGTVFKSLYSFISKFPTLQYIHLVGFDNIAALPLDPQCLSLIQTQDLDVICKVIETNSIQDDKIFYQNGYFKTMETQDSSMTENPENLMKMCLNDMYISVSFLNSLKNNHEKSMKFSQRYHTIRRGNSIQFEKHIQDIMEIANSSYLYQTEDYAFLIENEKKAVIQLSNVHKRYLKLEGTQDDQLVEITPNISYCGEDLKKVDKNAQFPMII